MQSTITVFTSLTVLQATEEFDISLQEINWLGTCVNVAYLPMSILVPLSLNRWGMRASCALGSLLLVIASWVRYAGSAEILPSTWRYKLLLMGQILAGCGQPWFQILGPTYSEVWFNGHATATMVLSVASPVGAALSQLIAPTFMTLLILAIITSITAPAVLLVCPAPRTLASQNGYGSPAPVLQALRALICRSRPGEIVMSPRECTDMAITTLIFGVIVSAFSAILILVNQILTPHGYSPREASTMSGVLVLAGFIGAVITSPIVDRYLSGYLPFVAKVFAPMAAIAYIMLIWDST
ncbi:Major facilitator superfamily domain-containing protein [Ceratobasidium theobromae]|uniref:Major facilitator superfamily domain-containing protein n=1 Tax=Ceratobasidium theobromae TaxID=1582974 RepID=A0A5N5QM02_9AGAM|nr:Major facilitator superfamily domain-containing protein [Ceratobasidium theobromae]